MKTVNNKLQFESLVDYQILVNFNLNLFHKNAPLLTGRFAFACFAV